MTIGTARPSAEQLRAVKHHFIGSHSITDDLNAGRFEKEALAVLETLFKEKNTVVMAGGSGLYIDAVCKGFDKLPQADQETRAYLETVMQEKGIEELQRMLKKLDPEHYKKVDPKNPHRLLRALEVCLVTGKPYSALRKGAAVKRDFTTIKIGLLPERAELYRNIDTRVDAMMAAGLLEEVRSLAAFRNKNALQTVGYREIFDHLDGTTDLHTAVNIIKQNTRSFARRQLTWFRRDKEILWFDPADKDKIIAYINSQTEHR